MTQCSMLMCITSALCVMTSVCRYKKTSFTVLVLVRYTVQAQGCWRLERNGKLDLFSIVTIIKIGLHVQVDKRIILVCLLERHSRSVVPVGAEMHQPSPLRKSAAIS